MPLISSPAWRMPLIFIAIVAVGVCLGVVFPEEKLSAPWGVLQACVGWTYTAAWSLSFYPQVVLNFRRKKVTGLSFDFLALNLLGWLAYSTFNVAIYYVFECPHKPRRLGGLAAAHDSAAAVAAAAAAPLAGPNSPAAGLSPTFLGAGPRAADVLTLGETGFCQYAVEFNDVVFAVHALILTLITLLQCCIYSRGKQRVHGAVVATIAAAVAAALLYAAAIWGRWQLGVYVQPWLEWMYWLYFLSYIKMGVTLVKYVPQAVFNRRRRSTQGWSILNILLDFMGGVLSMGQQLITCYITGDWAPVTSNPVKLGLAVTSMMFDLVFMVQHYVLYADKQQPTLGGDEALLLPLLWEGDDSTEEHKSASNLGPHQRSNVVESNIESNVESNEAGRAWMQPDVPGSIV